MSTEDLGGFDPGMILRFTVEGESARQIYERARRIADAFYGDHSRVGDMLLTNVRDVTPVRREGADQILTWEAQCNAYVWTEGDPFRGDT